MLQHFLITEVFSFLLIFARLGSGIMVLPGFGEAYVSGRIRLLIALGFTLVLVPVMGQYMPKPPTQPLMLIVLLGGEILVGLFIGALTRIIISAMHVAGTVIATQSSLANAMIFDIMQAGQTTAVTNLMSLTALVVVFVTDLHHVMLKALVDSYMVFTPGIFPPTQDLANYATRAVSHAFAVGIQLAAPHIAIGVILYLAAGLLARVMPTMQVFYILMAPQIMIAFFVLMSVFSGIMLWYSRYFEDSLTTMLTP